MARAVIIYASLTGSTEEVARILADHLKKSHLEVEVIDCEQTDAAVFLTADICVVATYTFGSEGDLPDEILPIYNELGKMDLTGKVFGVLGTGEEVYGYFCKSVDDFDRQFERTGAARGAEVVKVENLADASDEERIGLFARDLISSFEKRKDKI